MEKKVEGGQRGRTNEKEKRSIRKKIGINKRTFIGDDHSHIHPSLLISKLKSHILQDWYLFPSSHHCIRHYHSLYLPVFIPMGRQESLK
jgi:hypothetical protein